MRIENESFEFPWCEEDFVRCSSQNNCEGMVAEDDNGRVVGFMVYKLHKTRIHLLNFAVARAYRRHSIGSQMIAKLFTRLSAQRKEKIVLEVRETNKVAQIFFRKNGFKAISILRGFYIDTPEDAYYMQHKYCHTTHLAPLPQEIIERLG